MRIIMGVAAVALSLAACSEPAPPPPAPTQFDRVGSDLVENGRRLSAVLGCSGCHGADLAGEDWSEPGFGRMWTSNLTRAIPAYTDAQLEATIRRGRRPDGSDLWGMPSHLFTDLSPEDMAAVIAYLRTLTPTGDIHPRPVFEAGGQAEIAAGTFKTAAAEVAATDTALLPDMGASYDLGRYIARATCAECHGMDLKGGTPYPGAAHRPDLRMVTAYDAAQFERLLRTGAPIGDRDLELMGEVARGRFTHFTPHEMQALHRYLQKVGSEPSD